MQRTRNIDGAFVLLRAPYRSSSSVLVVQIATRLEIHFHTQHEASVLIESASPSSEERFGEILLFSLVAARMLVNLGGASNPEGAGLARLLNTCEGNLEEFALYESPDAPSLVGYQGAKGRKGFKANLTATDDNLGFKLKPWGMGFMGSGAGFYSPHAVLLLLRHLAHSRTGEREYVDGLGLAASTVGGAALSGQLSLRSQAEVAMTSAVLGGAEFLPG